MSKPSSSSTVRPSRKHAAVSSSRTPLHQGHQLLAPSLASAAVLLAVMGLSREIFMHELRSFHVMPTRQLTVGEFAKSPASAAPHGGFADGFGSEEKGLVADRPRRITRENLNEITPRSDDVSGYRAQGKGQNGKEIDALRLSQSRELNAQPEPLTALEIDGETGAALRASDKQENNRSGELAQAGQSAFESPLEESRQTRLRKKADLSGKDEGFVLTDNDLIRREFEESVSGRKGAGLQAASNKTNSPLVQISETELLDAAVIAGAMNQDKNFDFLAHYQQTEDLIFQPATGYWANTYIPGDPAIRLLRSRLAQQDRSWLEHNAALEQDVEPLQQPFDAPANNALALSLMADTKSIGDHEDGATRMRLQVGIRGIEHRRGQRPGMNVGIVVDLPADAPDDVRIATRALLDALLQSQQAGDRFSLVMTDSGLVVEAEDFRFGSLQVVKQQILGQNADTRIADLETPEQKLQAAMQQATAMVQQTDDPSRPLGSSSVLLISANTLEDIEQLSGLVHEKAKEGITLSIVPLGSKPQTQAVEKLVLAGLGNRRYLEAPGQARQLIEEELHASSRAVARAARLSVRLAPGVRLIGMVGSERLDNQRAQRVREIENSMDLRLSTNLGIQADRGEDEDGIQIVIPSIFSGDSVTVLLDVVTDRPGAIADVSLRYKDLVFLRNGNLQGHLDLPAAAPERGPRELVVLKNLLSYHFVEAVEKAAAALGRQQPAVAIAALSEMHNTIEQARYDISAWANNPDLKRDQQVLDRYLTVLALPQAGSHQSFLTDSLLYAAWAKTHRSPKEWKL